MSHDDPRIRDLLAACPSVAPQLDLSEGANYIMSQTGFLLRDRKLTESVEACVYAYVNRLAEGDKDAQNLLVVNVLEALGDSPDAISVAKQHLSGRALLLLERMIRGWALRRPR